MRVIVVDDENFARQSIINVINSKFTDIEVVGQSESVKDAIEQIKNKKPDLVFLDIDLTDGTGFDLLNVIETIPFKIIFVTAHNEFAIKAIKFSALDYLLKPVDSLELEVAINRAKESINIGLEQQKIGTFVHNFSSKSKGDKKILLRTSDRLHIIAISDIVRCESQNNYTLFIIKDKRRILISKSMKFYEDMFLAHNFVRVHRSHLINAKFVVCFDKKNNGYVTLADGEKVPVSLRKTQELSEKIAEMYDE